MKILSKLKTDENKILLVLENGEIRFVHESFITEKDTVRKVFTRNAFSPATAKKEELEAMGRIEALSTYGKHVRLAETGQIINIVKYFKGKK